MNAEQHNFFMNEAILLAKKAFALGEVPIGAVVVWNNKIIGSGYNQKENKKDIFAHAEILAIQEAQKFLNKWRLNDCTIYSTLEPCFMCASALVHCRINHLYFGPKDKKFGGIVSLYNIATDIRLNHRFSFTEGLKEEESTTLLKDFFQALRVKN